MAAEDSDIALVDGGVKLLTSKDYIIRDMAWVELEDDAAHKYKAPLVTGKQDFLNSGKNSLNDRVANRYTSAWTRARQAAKRLGVTWRLLPDNEVEILADDIVIDDRSAIFRNLRSIIWKRRTLSLRAHIQQGKTNTCIAAARESSHFFID